MEIIWGQYYSMWIWIVSFIIYVDFSKDTGWSYLWINLNRIWNMKVSIVSFLLNIHQNHRNKFKKIREVLIIPTLTLKIHNQKKRITREAYWKLTKTKFLRIRLTLRSWWVTEQELVIRTEWFLAFGLVLGQGQCREQAKLQLFVDLLHHLFSGRTWHCTQGQEWDTCPSVHSRIPTHLLRRLTFPLSYATVEFLVLRCSAKHQLMQTAYRNSERQNFVV